MAKQQQKKNYEPPQFKLVTPTGGVVNRVPYNTLEEREQAATQALRLLDGWMTNAPHVVKELTITRV